MFREAPVCDDEATLYAEFGERLLKAVRRIVSTSEENVEDACSFAWMQLFRTDPERGPRLFAWLKTVAVREAIRLDGRTRRSVALEDVTLGGIPGGDTLESAVEVREALTAVANLPDRQREMFSLFVAGYGYREIGQRTGATTRTVERQLLRARRRLRE